jgi:hypothetical protein
LSLNGFSPFNTCWKLIKSPSKISCVAIILVLVTPLRVWLVVHIYPFE